MEFVYKSAVYDGVEGLESCALAWSDILHVLEHMSWEKAWVWGYESHTTQCNMRSNSVDTTIAYYYIVPT